MLRNKKRKISVSNSGKLGRGARIKIIYNNLQGSWTRENILKSSTSHFLPFVQGIGFHLQLLFEASYPGWTNYDKYSSPPEYSRTVG